MDQQVRKAEAVIPHQEIVGPDVRDLGVHHHPTHLLGDLDHDDAHRRADLGGCHRPAHVEPLAGGLESVPQVVGDQTDRRRLGILGALAADPQDRIAELANATDGHSGRLMCAFVCAVQPRSGSTVLPQGRDGVP